MGLVDSLAIFLDDDIGTLENVVRGGRITAKMTQKHAEDAYKALKSYENSINNGVLRTLEGWNFTNNDRQIEIAGENEAILALLEASVGYGWTGATYGLKVATNPITKLVGVVLSAYLLCIPEQYLRKMAIEVGVPVAKFAVKREIKDRLQKKIIKELVESVGGTKAYKTIAKKLRVSSGTSKAGGIGYVLTLLQLQGLAQEAAKGSRRLRRDAPGLHAALRQNPPSLGSRISRAVQVAEQTVNPLSAENLKPSKPGKKQSVSVSAGLDMLYFLAEPQLRPYVIAIDFARRHPAAFRKFVDFFASVSK